MRVLIVVMLLLAGQLASAQTGSAGGGTGASRTRTGSAVSGPHGIPVSAVGNKPCFDPVCLTTLINGRQLTPKLWYPVSGILQSRRLMTTVVGVCLRGSRSVDCPVTSMFPGKFAATEPDGYVQDQINFGDLAPGCFELRWNVGRRTEVLSVPFAIHRSFRDRFRC